MIKLISMKSLKIQLVLLLALVVTSCNQSTKSEKNALPDEVTTNVSNESLDVKSATMKLIQQADKLDGTDREKIISLARQWGDITENASSEEKKELSELAESITEEEHAYLSLLSAVYYFVTNDMQSDLDECLSDFKRLQDAK